MAEGIIDYRTGVNISTKGGTPPAREKELIRVMNDLSNTIDSLEVFTNDLRKRLDPFISNLPDDPSELMKESPYSSEFCNTMNTKVSRLRSIKNTVQYMLERLEI